MIVVAVLSQAEKCCVCLLTSANDGSSTLEASKTEAANGAYGMATCPTLALTSE